MNSLIEGLAFAKSRDPYLARPCFAISDKPWTKKTTTPSHLPPAKRNQWNHGKNYLYLRPEIKKDRQQHHSNNRKNKHIFGVHDLLGCGLVSWEAK